MARIRISAGGYDFVAETEAGAPKTVARFLNLLPYRQKLIHVRWSGEGCWVPLGTKISICPGKTPPAIRQPVAYFSIPVATARPRSSWPMAPAALPANWGN